MVRFLIRRLAYMAVIMVIASMVVFVALRITPGDSTNFVITPISSPERFEQLRHELGLDRPLIEQYGVFIGRIVSLNLGSSDISHRQIVDIVASGLPYTLILALAAALIVYGIGIPLGVIAALRRDRWPDQLISGSAVLGLGIPNFVLAIILIMIFALTLKVLPVSGANGLPNLILPAIVLARRAVRRHHAGGAILGDRPAEPGLCPNADREGPQQTADRVGPRAAELARPGHLACGGAVPLHAGLHALIVEVIFRWPGLGSQLVDAVLKRDYLVAQVLALLLTLVVIVLNTMADVAYAYADPKVRVVVGRS